MIVMLCNEDDVSARWAAEALRSRGHAVRVLTGGDLTGALTWNHTVGAAGADCEIGFAAGDRLRVGSTRGVLNRLASLPVAWFQRYGGPDRDYAIQEMHAFYLSWLHALPGPVLNPPTPQGLAGNWRHPSAWAALAVNAGLPVHPFRQDSDGAAEVSCHAVPASARAYVVGARVVADDVVAQHRAACLRLSRASATPLLGLAFAPDAAGEWRMCGASVSPDLIGGGEPLLAALEEALLS